MKIAIYIENGRTQVVLTPEDDFETNALAALTRGHHITVTEGEFYHCAGGWVRQGCGTNSVMLLVGKDTV